MKPLNLLVLLLFLAGAVWALTRSERSVREIQRAYYGAIGPFLRSGSALETKARTFLEETRHSKQLEQQVRDLDGEVGRLRVIEERYRELEQENDRLRRALGFKQNAPFDVITARVIRRQPSTWWQTVIIDRGQESGIGVQLPVVSNEGLVGKIDEPFDRMSTVILLTDAKCQVSARIEGTGEAGILGGQRGMADGSPLLRLRFLDKNAPVRGGMRVLSTGRGGLFPANLLLGTIETFEPGAFDAEALVKPAVDFMNLETVFVVMRKPDKP
jgi:rod shape-determining protein MreC